MSKSALSLIKKRVEAHLEHHFEVTPAPGFVVGVSGGADSMALLHLFKRIGLDAIVVHVNYRKRGDASDKDQELVEKMAEAWGYDCHSIRLDPEGAGGSNFQKWAREQRYHAFRTLAKEYGRAGVAVAHNRDDQIETILQKLFRGAGLESWGGMSVWDGELFRPLLDSGRDEIMKYIEDNAVPYRTDESNLESGFARNLLRNEWLIKLEQHFPGWEQNILRLPEQADLFGVALRYISEEIVSEGRKINREAFSELDPDLQKALLLHLLKELDPSVKVSAHALDQLHDLNSLQTGQAIQLNSDWYLIRGRDSYLLDRKEGAGHPKEDADTLSKEDLLGKEPVQLGGMLFSLNSFSDPDYETNLYLDTADIGFPLTVRRWKEGDSFQPLGMQGHQKVSDHLTNRKVNAARKEQAMVLESHNGVVRAVLFPPEGNEGPPGTISEQVRCSTDTCECLVIRRVKRQT